MDFNKLDIYTWHELVNAGDIVSGYQGTFLTRKGKAKFNLLIFKDEKQKLHFVIQDSSVNKSDIKDPKVNGLKISLERYKFAETGIKQFVDIECSLTAYISEFTEVVKEIAEKILIEEVKPIKAVTDIINGWKTFWGKQAKEVLSEEEQIGLICELKVLKKLVVFDSEKALAAWKGPLNEKYDFIFPAWCFEVKGTRKEGHSHTINGLDQLNTPSDKSLALISFLATKSLKEEAFSLQDAIDDFVNNVFNNSPALTVKFYELLIHSGYSRVYVNEYRKVKFEIYDGLFFPVNKDFPKLTSDDLKQPLNSRISEVSYKVDLDGLESQRFDELNIDQYY